jgi:hypothetical protein
VRTQLAEQINGARRFAIDECFYWVLASTTAENWVNSTQRWTQIVDGFQADGIIRGPVVGLERAYIAGAVLAVRIEVTAVHGNTSAQLGTTALVPVNLGILANWEEHGAPLLGLRFSDQIEAIVPVRNPDYGAYLTPNEYCEPMVVGDRAGSALITEYFSSWFEHDLDAIEQQAAQGLLG